MQTRLTKRVFRAILNNEPLLSSQCRNRSLHTVRPYRLRRAANNPIYIQRRGLFAFNITPPNDPPPATLPSEVGLKPMRDLVRSLTDQSRGPGNDVLAKAFQDFFETRAGEPGVITHFQARLLSTTWKHLHTHEEELEPEDWQRVFGTESLDNVLFVLSEATCLPEAREVVRKVARYVFLHLCEDHGSGRNQISRLALLAYINIQALNSNPEEARHTVEKFWFRLRKTKPSPWLTVMRGFAIEGDKRQIRRIAEKLDEDGTNFDPSSQEELVHLLIAQNLLPATKAVYECPLSEGQEPNISTKAAIIRHAILTSDTAGVEPVYESLLSAPIPETIGTRLLWAAAHGKNASDIEKDVEVLATNDPKVMASLTISCVNDLMQYANSIENPSLASGFQELARVWGLVPDSQTQLLHLESHIQAGNISEALQYLGELEDLDVTAPENLHLMNKLIKMFCFSGQDDITYDRVSSFLDPLFDNNVRLESDALAALTHLLLYRHDWAGVSELLRPRLGLYDSEERTKVRNALVNFILDTNQDSKHAWDSYGLLQVAFPETGVGKRTEIMTSFYKRGRSDLAFLIFGHMRQAENFSQRPKPDTYARCFQGIAWTQDSKHVGLVHNMLKLDTEVDLNTRLLNWLMLAYAECDKPEKSMSIFRDILQSEEGPSHRTISFFFKVCEKHHNGTHEAIKMMEKLKVLDVTVDRRLYMAYVEALAAQCEFDLATEALDTMNEVTGYEPTFTSIGLLYNAIPYQYWKDEVENWAKEKYPDLWAQLEGLERTEHEEGQKFELPGSEWLNRYV
ncbi:putative mitochondrial respiratory complex I chaperone (Cia84) [Aspergillus lucknowensis]|uniref:Mitochondrial respiratory complex I chaperone n=1 Tax=Aspergillus lucknowensis TaxID=176173 RepID=A0ABR4LPB5_9EURO